MIGRAAFIAAVKRAMIFTNQDSMAIKLDISKNKMAISKNTPYMGEVREEVGVSYKGKDLTVGF